MHAIPGVENSFKVFIWLYRNRCCAAVLLWLYSRSRPSPRRLNNDPTGFLDTPTHTLTYLLLLCIVTFKFQSSLTYTIRCWRGTWFFDDWNRSQIFKYQVDRAFPFGMTADAGCCCWVWPCKQIKWPQHVHLTKRWSTSYWDTPRPPPRPITKSNSSILAPQFRSIAPEGMDRWRSCRVYTTHISNFGQNIRCLVCWTSFFFKLAGVPSHRPAASAIQQVRSVGDGWRVVWLAGWLAGWMDGWLAHGQGQHFFHICF